MNASHWPAPKRRVARQRPSRRHEVATIGPRRLATPMRTRRLAARLLVMCAFLSAATAGAATASLPPRIGTLYLSVLSFSRSQPAHRHLTRQCQTRIGPHHYVTFLGVGHHRSLIVAFSRQPLSDPSRDIALGPLFVMKRGLLQPRAYDPRAKTPTIDWGYIFDANADGRVDYLAYLESASPVAPTDATANLPPLLGTITGKAYKLGMRRTELVFWHAIDTDHSGWTDVLLAPMKDRRTGWVDSTLLLTGMHRAGQPPHCVWFQGKPGHAMHPCGKGGDGFTVAGKQVLGLRTVPPRGDFLERVNATARQCHFGANAFYRGPLEARQNMTSAH